MKKFTLLVASLFVAIGAMAQETIRLTFERTGTTASTVAVSVVDENGDAVANATATVTEESTYGFKGTAGNITSAILCPNVNATASPTITLAFTISGVSGFSFNNVGLHIHGLNGQSCYQSNSDNKTRQWNVATTVGGNAFGSLSNIDIAAGIEGVNKMWNIAGATTNIDGETVVKLTITKGTTNEGCFFGLSEVKLSTAAVETDNTEAVAALDAAIANAEAMAAYVGEGVGKYTYTGEDNYEEAFAAIVAYREAIEATNTPTPAEVEAETEKLNNLVASFELNMPEAGKYYRLYCAAGNLYLSSDISSDRLEMQSKDATSASQIFLCVENGDDFALLSYAEGQAINAYNLDAVGTMSAVKFSTTYNGVMAQYNIKIANSRYIYGQGNTQNNHIDSGTGNPNGNGYNWTIEEVETLPVTVTEAGYATLYAPVALTVPAGVTAHTVTLNGELATLSEALEVIPANTGVVLAGAGSHSFAITTSDAFNGTNALSGTVAATNIGDDAYVLANGANGVGFYIATKNQEENAKWLNNSHKAYLPKPAGSESVACYSFRFGEGTTGIENVKGENGNVKAIFDLTGRKVNSISAPGIYIVNGKKVLVK